MDSNLQQTEPICPIIDIDDDNVVEIEPIPQQTHINAILPSSELPKWIFLDYCCRIFIRMFF